MLAYAMKLGHLTRGCYSVPLIVRDAQSLTKSRRSHSYEHINTSLCFANWSCDGEAAFLHETVIIASNLRGWMAILVLSRASTSAIHSSSTKVSSEDPSLFPGNGEERQPIVVPRLMEATIPSCARYRLPTWDNSKRLQPLSASYSGFHYRGVSVSPPALCHQPRRHMNRVQAGHLTPTRALNISESACLFFAAD